ncbi:MAG: NGG1p interacting factor 3 protein, NIF3 [Bacteroidetes bacterium OLB11]|nr:MAG: NGG1p interacting factor 3 protein, NIF3 [Bacteroidetes bacterium OLB11]
MVKLKDIIREIELYAPPIFQENYDNSGLIVGDSEMEIHGAIICLDAIESVIDEAIEKKCNLVIAHHPIVFSGLKSITGKNYIEKTIIKAIKNDIAIYAAHTNLDNVYNGVNQKIAQKLKLKNFTILDPMKTTLRKLQVLVPQTHYEIVRQSILNAGAGNIGNYSNCSFNTQGIGTFQANKHANPYVGNIHEIHYENEYKVEVIFTKDKENAIIQAMRDLHPYEEIAYDILSLENTNPYIGAGLIGELENECKPNEFLSLVKNAFQTACIRYTESTKNIKTVALCGGSGSFLLPRAIAKGAQAFLTADFKYHQFF